MTDVEFLAERINKHLAGAVIQNAALTEDNESVGFVVKKGGKQFTVWVDCDPEGNHAGWLQIEDKS